MLPPPGRPRLLSDPFLSVPPNTPTEQALAPWVPGPLRVLPVCRCLLEEADLSSPASRGRPAPCSLLPGAPNGAGMWALVGDREAAVGAAQGFFIWQLLPPCLSQTRSGCLQKGQLSSGFSLFALLGDRSCLSGCF